MLAAEHSGNEKRDGHDVRDKDGRAATHTTKDEIRADVGRLTRKCTLSSSPAQRRTAERAFLALLWWQAYLSRVRARQDWVVIDVERWEEDRFVWGVGGVGGEIRLQLKVLRINFNQAVLAEFITPCVVYNDSGLLVQFVSSGVVRGIIKMLSIVNKRVGFHIFHTCDDSPAPTSSTSFL